MKTDISKRENYWLLLGTIGGFLIAFISIVAAIGMVLLGNNLSAFFNDIGLALGNAGDSLSQLPFGS